MTIRLSEKAPTLKEALGKLKTRTDAARLQLEQLGVIKDGVEISDPTASSEMTEQERRMRQMAMMRSSRGGGGRKPKEPPKSVTVASTVTAKWALGKKTGVELLEFCHNTQEKVAAADLAGLKDKKTTAEEEEIAEEAAEMMSFNDGSSNPAEPTFFYVGKISQAARNQAMKEAFAKAKAAAEDLATAAGAKLGKLSSLAESGGGSFSPYDFESEYGYSSRTQALRQMMSRNANEDQDEAISPSPDAVGVHVAVHATFSLE
jgi:hypothetical protein